MRSSRGKFSAPGWAQAALVATYCWWQFRYFTRYGTIVWARHPHDTLNYAVCDQLCELRNKHTKTESGSRLTS